MILRKVLQLNVSAGPSAASVGTIELEHEMFIENQNDDVADKDYHRVAGQAEFDVF